MRKVLVVIDGKNVTLQCDDNGRITIQTLERLLTHMLGSDRFQMWVSTQNSAMQPTANGKKE